MKRIFLYTLLALTLGLWGCGGQNVRPIDIHDQVISVESRRFVADAQDAVSIARSGVDYAREKLDSTRSQRQALLAGEGWKGVPEGALQSFHKLMDARVELAELRLELAEARVDLAREKLREVYAETALRHDLETYEMKPIREAVQARLDAVRKINGRIGDQLLVVDRDSRAWWKTYRNLLSTQKHPDMFFTGF